MRKLLIPIIAFVLVLSSCEDDLTSLNDDPKSTAEVPAEPLFSNAMVSLGTLQNTLDYNTNISIFMAQYLAQTTYPDETQYDLTNRTIPSNYWEELYTNVLKNLDDASALVSEEQFTPDVEKANKQAQIEIIKVMAWYKLVTTFGNIPYSEALQSDNASPVYDDAQTIYADLLSRLDSAISSIDASSVGFVSGDIFYNGDLTNWLKLAHSLRMRLAMTVVDNPPSGVNPQAIVEASSPNAFTSNDDNAIITYTPPPPNTNPLWEDLVQSGRHDFVPTNTLVDFMNDVNDPRRPIWFTQIDTNTVEGGSEELAYVGGAYGYQNSYSANSHVDDLFKLQDFEGTVMAYDEVEFLRAEAAVRGWSTSKTAEQHYNDAVRADMNYWSNALARYEVGSSGDEITDEEMTQYLTTDAPFPTAGTMDQINAIAEQKWLAQYPHVAHQAWVDYRRFDHPTFNLAQNISAEDEIPVRWIYPVDEQNLNETNREEAASAIGGDETSTHLFWDVADASSN